jgi:hypothetical protein
MQDLCAARAVAGNNSPQIYSIRTVAAAITARTSFTLRRDMQSCYYYGLGENGALCV